MEEHEQRRRTKKMSRGRVTHLGRWRATGEDGDWRVTGAEDGDTRGRNGDRGAIVLPSSRLGFSMNEWGRGKKGGLGCSSSGSGRSLFFKKT
ncbi:hypothetical protein HN51_065048 [Arachis hypogaea]